MLVKLVQRQLDNQGSCLTERAGRGDLLHRDRVLRTAGQQEVGLPQPFSQMQAPNVCYFGIVAAFEKTWVGQRLHSLQQEK